MPFYPYPPTHRFDSPMRLIPHNPPMVVKKLRSPVLRSKPRKPWNQLKRFGVVSNRDHLAQQVCERNLTQGLACIGFPDKVYENDDDKEIEQRFFCLHCICHPEI